MSKHYPYSESKITWTIEDESLPWYPNRGHNRRTQNCMDYANFGINNAGLIAVWCSNHDDSHASSRLFCRRPPNVGPAGRLPQKDDSRFDAVSLRAHLLITACSYLQIL